MGVAEIIDLILSLGPQAANLFFQIEGLLNLGSSEKQNIANALAASNTADAATISSATAWLKANGLPVPPAAALDSFKSRDIE